MQKFPVAKLGYTIPEASHSIGVGRTKTYELINEGELETIHIGRRTIITNVREYMERKRREAGHVKDADEEGINAKAETFAADAENVLASDDKEGTEADDAQAA